uniref:Uncharacterized protein n=1 Tax=Chenopodium quinoa TaxID=63459 RepID=A0A803M975_CHEQI
MVKYLFVLGESLAMFGVSRKSYYIWTMSKEGGEDPWSEWSLGGSSEASYKDLLCCSRARNTLIYYDEKSAKFLLRVPDLKGWVMSCKLSTRAYWKSQLQWL